MVYDLLISIETDYLVARVSGRQTLQDNRALVEELVSACLAHKLEKILVDLTGLVGQPGTMSDYQLAIFAVQKGLPEIKKIALITTPGNLRHTEFFETTARNRGLNVRAFLEGEDARAWICEG